MPIVTGKQRRRESPKHGDVVDIGNAMRPIRRYKTADCFSVFPTSLPERQQTQGSLLRSEYPSWEACHGSAPSEGYKNRWALVLYQ